MRNQISDELSCDYPDDPQQDFCQGVRFQTKKVKDEISIAKYPKKYIQRTKLR